MEKRSVVLLGGDKRQYYMAKSLAQRGFVIFYYGIRFPKEIVGVKYCRKKEQLLEKLATCDAVIFPILYKMDELLISDVLRSVRRGIRVYGGGFSDAETEILLEKEVFLYDFINSDTDVMLRDELIAEAIIITILFMEEERELEEIATFFPGKAAAEYVGEKMAEIIYADLKASESSVL